MGKACQGQGGMCKFRDFLVFVEKPFTVRTKCPVIKQFHGPGGNNSGVMTGKCENEAKERKATANMI